MNALVRETYDEDLFMKGWRDDTARKLFPGLALALGFKTVLADGKWGIFQSSTKDTVILPIYALTGSWEDATNRAICDFFNNSSGTYIDIGANIGLTTVPVAQNCRVNTFSFEPDPINYKNMIENIRRNCVGQNFQARQIALYDSSGTVKLSLSSNNMGDHRIVTSHDEERTHIIVETARLDDLFEDIQFPLVIKIDVQGAEAAVIRGGRSTFEKADLLFIEYCPYMINRLNEDAEEILSLISRYKIIGLTKVGAKHGQIFESPENAIKILREAFSKEKNNEGFYIDIAASHSFPIDSYLYL